MDEICDLRLETVTDSKWIRVRQVNYKQNGINKKQEVICSHDSCSILIHNTSRDVFVFVKQFRPAVLMHEVGWRTMPLNGSDCINFSDENLKKGFTLELCAGIIDKDGKSIKEIAAEEVLEECGYKIKPENLELVLATRNNSLYSGTLQHLFYARVTDEMRIEGEGGGNVEEGEFIEVLEIKTGKVLFSMFDDSMPKPVGLTFALVWFLFTKSSSSALELPSSASDAQDGSEGGATDAQKSNSMERKKRHSDTCRELPSKKSRAGGTNDDKDTLSCDKNGLNVTDVEMSEVGSVSELQISRLHYKHNNFQKAWDFFYAKSTCTTLVHNVSRDSFLLIRKFSPAVYGSIYQQMIANKASGSLDASVACLTQLCSTNYEEGEEPCKAASENVLQTFGFKVPPSEFRKIVQSRSNVGISGALLTSLYVKVNNEMKVAEVEGERDYEIVEIPVHSGDRLETAALQILMEQQKNPLSLSLAILWYYYQKTDLAK